MAIAGHTKPLQSPTGFLSAQERYGDIRRQMMAREKQEMMAREKDFIEMMSIESLDALVDGYQDVYQERATGFIDMAKEAYKKNDMRIGAEDRAKLMKQKRDLERTRRMYEESFNNYVEDRNTLAQDVATNGGKYNSQESIARGNEVYESMRKGEVYVKNSMFVPEYTPVSEIFTEVSKTMFGSPSAISVKKTKEQDGKEVTTGDKWFTTFGGETEEDMYRNRYEKAMNFLKDDTNPKAREAKRTIIKVVKEAAEEEDAIFEGDTFEDVFAVYHQLKGGEVAGGLYVGGDMDSFGTVRRDRSRAEEPISSRRGGGRSPEYYQVGMSEQKNYTSEGITLKGSSFVYGANKQPRIELGEEFYEEFKMTESDVANVPVDVVAVGADKAVLRVTKDKAQDRKPIKVDGSPITDGSKESFAKALAKATMNASPEDVIYVDGMWQVGESVRRENVVVSVDPDEDSNFWRALGSLDPEARNRALRLKRSQGEEAPAEETTDEDARGFTL